MLNIYSERQEIKHNYALSNKLCRPFVGP